MVSDWKKRCYSVNAMREEAQRILPKPFFDYVDGGAEDETTMHGNLAAFSQIHFKPKPLNGSAARDLSVEVLGQRWSMPLMIGPTGLSGLYWPDGEICTARAAEAASIGICLSHASTCTLEKFAQTASSPKWMQVFVYRDRGFTHALADRAAAAGYEGLVVTIDNQLVGSRERDIRNGFSIPPQFGLIGSMKIAMKTRWLWRMRSKLRHLNLANYQPDKKGDNMVSVSTRIRDLLDTRMNWDDISEIRKYWPGKLIIKGILHPDEAIEAKERGVDALIVSNHGGRQLDGACPTLTALPPIVDALHGSLPILLDSGVRRGSDIFKAIALGATACLIGRPPLWGLSVAGTAGVSHILDIYRTELDRAMGLCGLSHINEISSKYLVDNMNALNLTNSDSKK